jgi:hypothetical protein
MFHIQPCGVQRIPKPYRQGSQLLAVAEFDCKLMLEHAGDADLFVRGGLAAFVIF